MPANQPDSYTKVGSGVGFVSPVYDNLETNITHTLMNYSDQKFPDNTLLFPHHSDVLAYLRKYGEEVEPLISFEKQVVRIEKDTNQPEAKWAVEIKDLASNNIVSQEYDAIMVASGHYSEPYLPDVRGLVEFSKAYPDSIIHSKYYKIPDVFEGKKVIVVGNSASGIDISNQVAEHAKLPVLISLKDKYGASASSANGWSRYVPEITEFKASNRSVCFSDGSIETEVDAVIFCTGYHYVFPFLKQSQSPVFVPSGAYADHLWHHMLYTKDPSLAFLCIPQLIVPFPFGEAQAAVIARMWSGRLATPSTEDMDRWVSELRAVKGDAKARHLLPSQQDTAYINAFHKLAMDATPKEGLENNGAGKVPPFWDERAAWLRLMTFNIKVAMRALGKKRLEVFTLDQLGFNFDDWKAETQ